MKVEPDHPVFIELLKKTEQGSLVWHGDHKSGFTTETTPFKITGVGFHIQVKKDRFRGLKFVLTISDRDLRSMISKFASEREIACLETNAQAEGPSMELYQMIQLAYARKPERKATPSLDEVLERLKE